MGEQAKVTSLEALEAFRARLILFLHASHRSVDEVRDEVRRTRQWLQAEQRTHWENEARRWRRQLAQAEQELFSAKLSGLRDSCLLQEAAVLKARRALQEAEEKLQKIKVWNRDFESRTEPLVKRLESLRHFLDFDLPKGISFLLQAQKTLESYAERTAPPTQAPPVSASAPADVVPPPEPPPEEPPRPAAPQP